MLPKVDLNEVKEKLIEKLRPSGWAQELKGFLRSSDFDKLLQSLYNDRCADKRFTPTLKQVFRAFEECPVDKLKVLMIGQDPYPGMGIADGIAFSCGNTNYPQPSLLKIFEAINECYGITNPDIKHNPDLTRWANQGVLLLNLALTCRIGQSESHMDIWHDFIIYTMDRINEMSKNREIFVVYMGRKALAMDVYLPNTSPESMNLEHPMAAGYEHRPWHYRHIFKIINDYLKRTNNTEISW